MPPGSIWSMRYMSTAILVIKLQTQLFSSSMLCNGDTHIIRFCHAKISDQLIIVLTDDTSVTAAKM